MNKSFWIETGNNCSQEIKKLNRDIETEVCIIGGGLTGLTTAYYLSKNGIKVTILEKNKLLSHASGNTTGKITSQHGLFYKYLIDSLGKEMAKEYLYANENAIKRIEEIVRIESIDCDFEKQDAYVFTQKEEQLKNLEDEIEALRKLDFKAELVDKIELPIEIVGAIKFRNQAQFNPCLYGIGLKECILKQNGDIFEDTKVLDLVKDKDKYIVVTTENKVTAKYVVIASHYPIINFPGYYFIKMYQETSYLIGGEVPNNFFTGMYISLDDNKLSFRMAKDGDKQIMLVGGMGHKTGEQRDLSDSYNSLENFGKKLYNEYKADYKWNTEDCISLDKIPYIGEFSTMMPNVYVGTGYKKWGMTSSNIAAEIISNKIMGGDNKYGKVFESTRLKPVKNYKELGNMIKEVSYSLVIKKFQEPNEELDNIENEEGKVVEIEGLKVGVYKDENGKIFAVKPVCSHLGCELSWNNLDKTWDCPCHGSRFDYKGKSIYDPSIKDLEILN